MEKQEKTIETLSLEKEAWMAEKEAWTAEKEALYSELAMLRAQISENKEKNRMKNYQGIITMKRKKFLFILVCILLLSACGSRTEEAPVEEDVKDSILRSCVDWRQIGIFRSVFFKMEYAQNEIWWRINLPSTLNGITDKDIVMYDSKGEPVKIYRCSFRINEIGDLIDIEIHYPRIAHDLDSAEIINVQIYENLITEDIWSWHSQRYNLFYDYQIKYAQNGILSVLFKGDACWGMNFDLETGEQIKLDQFVSPEEILWMIEDEQTEIDGMDREELNELVAEKIRFHGDISDFFIWEKGIGFPIWLEDRIYILVYIDIDGKRIDCNEINHTIFVKENIMEVREQFLAQKGYC